MKGYSRQVLVMGGLTALTVIVLIGLTFKLLHDISRGANELDQKRDRQLIAAAFAGVAGQVESLVADNAIWDDAVDHAYGATDPGWILETWGTSSGAANYDAAYVVDGGLGSVVGYAAGKKTETPALDRYGKGLERLVARLRSTAASGTVSGFLSTPLGPVAIAAAPILPATADKPLPEAKPRFLLMSKLLTPELVLKLGERIGLAKLAIAEGPKGDAFTAPIGEAALPAGFVTWSPAFPGDAVLARVWKPFLVTLMSVGLAVLILTLSAMRLARDLYLLENRPSEHGATVVLAEVDGDAATQDALRAGLSLIAAEFGAGTPAHQGPGFAALFDGKDAAEAAAAYARAAAAFVAEPFDIGGRQVRANLRLGEAHGDSGAACAELLRQAAAAMRAVPKAA